MLFQLVPEGFSDIMNNDNSIWKKILEYRNMRENLENVCDLHRAVCFILERTLRACFFPRPSLHNVLYLPKKKLWFFEQGFA